MQPSEPIRESVPADVRARVMPAVLDELARWGLERFSIEALAERHRIDAAMVYRYWEDRRQLIVDAVLSDLESESAGTDTGSLRGDLEALARNVTNRINTEVGRTILRALVMDTRGGHDEATRVRFWMVHFAAVRAIVDRARERGELREGVDTLAAVQIVLAPLNIRALYSDVPVDDGYCAAIVDMAWHALARR
ncbi:MULTISPECIES: TetR-like C-terminal domain-containing protein [unclassified Mycobacterium]|uniref:TetR-like C-terminal domain-containing protein n=1 Tax=unclassified Mycobacterium TaxID=2642494 RepID=UPI0007FBB9C3|nr:MULTISPECIES: TetR-like C-terminal domain-containing protein [unclassified Mycobacterium]OBG64883.1 TetR family transcriptional regulator [Mycobacterium sp. E735]OBG65599.1 TetR family transcriptional regulator [Mycobacterium sp. E188]OBG72183.1 TetR family transcriptional regulator [Mycobacterium sp. E3305]OBG78695.1 TetR family transcriptional regulator [Mycobacterium sp. E3298]OBH22494.1 TetR family transcriptional regulator [Mycobacterium sp. E1715]